MPPRRYTRCPACAEVIPAGARRCDHCDEDVVEYRLARVAPEPLPERRWSATAGLVVPLSVFLPVALCLFLFLIPSLARTTHSEPRKKCTSNLKQIGLGVVLYWQRHEEANPPFGRRELFETLVRDGELIDASIYVCPADPAWPVEGGDQGLGALSYETWQSAYMTPGLIARFGSRTPLAWDRTFDYHEDARNVLFFDGHVEEVQVANFDALLERYTLDDDRFVR